MSEAYERFLIKNAASINSLESGLRTLTYVLPGRFEEAELASEAIYCGVNFLSLYHDKILYRAAKDGKLYDNKGKKLVVEPTEQYKYYNYYARQNNLYKVLALIVTGTRLSEQLVEMVLHKKFTEKRRWQVVTTIEVLKAMCRVSLFMMTGRRMVTAEVIPERILDVGTLGEEPKDQDIWREKEKMDSLMGGGVHPTAEVSDVEKVWVGKRESMQYQSLKNVLESSKQTMSGGMDSLGGYIQSQVKRPQNVSNGPSLVRPFTGITGTVGELLYILRPVAYVMLLRKFGRKSWKPWVISLAIETASRIMVVRDLEFGSITSKLRRGEDQSFDWKREIETEELSRRRNMFIYYVLRSPVFEKYVEEKMSSFHKWTSEKPILSLFGSIIQDYIPLWKQYYFYTSAS